MNDTSTMTMTVKTSDGYFTYRFLNGTTFWRTCPTCNGLGRANTYRDWGHSSGGISLEKCLRCDGGGMVQMTPEAVTIHFTPVKTTEERIAELERRLAELEKTR